MSAAVNVEEMRKERKRRGSGSYTSWSVQATTNSASRPRFRLLDQQTNHEFSCRRSSDWNMECCTVFQTRNT
ncbi:hypothetical protein FIBSPDRAFT_161018 [Athelia psychrophila]|uniref:Uncharacterized protein n=1 Tax=Athelia psychrophila TaxID=1759441 RepID=A0A166SVA2_9AGAM|nr:hypothetical protein FIBSPDRAFT_161018 [Fibularhizoctonia sp. CBS 109695]